MSSTVCNFHGPDLLFSRFCYSPSFTGLKLVEQFPLICRQTAELIQIKFRGYSRHSSQISGLEDIEMKINSELTEIAEWLKVNKLSANINKTLCMLFSKKLNHADISIKLEGKLINRVSETKFLGVIIDDKLNWKAHISYISGQISRAIGVIIKARNLGKEALLSLYYTLIFSLFNIL